MRKKMPFIILILLLPLVLSFNTMKLEAEELESIEFENVKVYEYPKSKITVGTYNEVFYFNNVSQTEHYLEIYFIWNHTKNKEKAINDFKILADQLISRTDTSLLDEERNDLLNNKLQFEKVLTDGDINVNINNVNYRLKNKGYHLSLTIID